jgi:hypothetical protein
VKGNECSAGEGDEQRVRGRTGDGGEEDGRRVIECEADLIEPARPGGEGRRGGGWRYPSSRAAKDRGEGDEGERENEWRAQEKDKHKPETQQFN